MSIHYVASITETPLLDTESIRDHFLLPDLFAAGELRFQCCDMDRVIVGAACPTDKALKLEATDDLRADFFCQRRELGVINLSGKGTVTVDGEDFVIDALECLYVGRGSKEVTFSAENGDSPKFYLISYPAHKVYPTTKATQAEANQVALGSGDTCNERVIYQFIHETGIQSCQLVMGYTELKTGSVWNTMPAHTHDRRSEVYLYFDIPAENAVFHFMGDPQETRHLCMQNHQAVLSPAWSIHSGSGTANYKFVWAMGGENQRFDDMDPAPIVTLR